MSPFILLSTDFAELNAPPMINYGVVYPQAILMFVITMLYSVVQPLIVIFGAIYFGIAYVVYKYKLLFGQYLLLASLYLD
jgi:calcium permeable stress-gated cation channel